MANIELSEEERKALAEALDFNLSTLTDEIAHTDTREYREFLVERRELLTKIKEQLH